MHGKKPLSGGPTVFLPLLRRDACNLCTKTSNDAKLRICSACGEVSYCSTECQRQDWVSHKIRCGKTDKVDGEAFFPYLAFLAHALRLHSVPDTHHALSHAILNNPDKREPLVVLSNGLVAKLIVLGEKIPSSKSAQWWPTATCQLDQEILRSRIFNEGLGLPLALSICIGLAAQMYTTTAVPTGEVPAYQVTGRRRVRLAFLGSPISDFGVVRGSLTVPNQTRLVYYSTEQKKFIMGQDPKEHYRIYFTNLNGQEFLLDFGMRVYDFWNEVADPSPYNKYFRDKNHGAFPFYIAQRGDSCLLDNLLYEPHKRVSVLRDPKIHTLIHESDSLEKLADTSRIYSIMDEIAGYPVSPDDKTLATNFSFVVASLMRETMKDGEYNNFPLSYPVASPYKSTIPQEKEVEFHQYMKRLSKRLRKGKVSPEQWVADFQEAYKSL
ncbi:hypothetical protein JR316_0007325 [Psilocybe cubensis]|uniref:MYND-type domain-containing protein n=2 Tax=Psilocybe cubensis TaxID=181762 RepID=A0A8H8CGZ9_PSICU|nr:hypothetical protein JR316_0007325 [Psilocybe cubensis]KAH9480725.1 hypothetical protein JR316_0007325 [Psilocybe cubensis]